MKGLASTNTLFSRVNVSGRCARKHYGVVSLKTFDLAIHSHVARKRYDVLSLTVNVEAI